MKQLIQAIKNKLDEIDGVTIFVTPDENFLPKQVRLPAIGIKDGTISRRQGAGMTQDVTMEVKLILWVELAKNEASILGDAASGEIGTLDLAEAVHAILDDELLDIPGMEDAFSASEAASQMMDADRQLLEAKQVIYIYEKEENRPCTN